MTPSDSTPDSVVSFFIPTLSFHLGLEAGQAPSFVPLRGPRPKRPRYFEGHSLEEAEESSEEEEEEEEEFDPESYYSVDSGINVPDNFKVKSFLESTFRRCLPRKRRAIYREYPKPNLNIVSVPKADKDIVSILDRSFPTSDDRSLSRIQAAVLASSAPLANLWSQLISEGFSGKQDELIPAKEVIRTIRETLALIGNASSYISNSRRSMIVDKIRPSRPKLASFLKEVCAEDVGDTGKELFGPTIKKKISERADTIKSFNEALKKIDPPQTHYD